MMDGLAYALYRSVGTLLSLLPLRVAFGVGQTLGLAAYLLFPKYRRLARRNVDIAFGREMSEAERARLVRAHFTSLGGNLAAAFCIARLPREEIRSLVEIEGLELAHQAREEGKGFILVISHIGNWELFAQLFPILFECQLGTIYQRLGNPYIDAEVRENRGRLGVQLFERKEGFQGAISLLRTGGCVGVLVDQHAGDAGVWCPLFGRLASTSSLAAMLALRTGAVLLPGAVYTERPGRWKLVFRPRVQPETRDAGLVTAQLNLELERQIRARPSDWFWVHNRWKTPRPKFLLATYKRGVVSAPQVASEALQPFRVLIRATNWLGDAVMSVPAVQAIKRGRPDLHLTIFTPAKLADFWKTVPEVDDVIAIPAGESPLGVARRIAGKFEAAVLFPNSLRAGLEVWLAGIERRVGYAGHRRRWLLNQVWKDPKKEKKTALRPPRHQVHHYLQLAKFIGAETGGPVVIPPRAPLPDAQRRRIGLCPGAEYGPAKRWLPERFREVMNRFAAEDGGEWVLFGVAKDRAIADEILQGYTGPVRNLVGATTLAELIAELRGCAALVTNDTGTMHLAAWLGVPVIAIFGSTEPSLTGPLGEGHRIVRRHVECSPCFLRECPLDFRCMKSIEPGEVLAALRQTLVGTHGPLPQTVTTHRALRLASPSEPAEMAVVTAE